MQSGGGLGDPALNAAWPVTSPGHHVFRILQMRGYEVMAKQETPIPEEILQEIGAGASAAISGGYLWIRLPILNPPVPSSSGHTRIVATTHGNKPTGAMIEGNPVMINITATI